jgi:uncharacterized delta-60 repeat protein
MIYTACRSNLMRGILALVATALSPLALAAQDQIGSGDSKIYAIAGQPDGQLVAGGESVSGGNRVFTLARYTNHLTGALDLSFGSGGIVQTPFGACGSVACDSVIHAVALQPDGNILAGGQLTFMGPPPVSESVLARYLPTGALDPSFGTGGILRAGFGNVDAIIVQPDGNILVGAAIGIDPFSIAVTRYLPTGAPDPSFLSINAGTAPAVCENTFVPCRAVTPLALAPDGSIVVGRANSVARYLPTGSPDPSFSSAAGFPGSLYAVAAQFDGKVVAGGASLIGSTTGLPVLTLARYLPTGAFDPSFGTGGIVTLPGIGARTATQIDNAVYAVAVQPDGYIVAGGVTEGLDQHNFTVARREPSGAYDPRFGTQFTDFGAGGESFLTALTLVASPYLETLDVVAAGPVLPVFGGNGFFQFTFVDYTGNDFNTLTGTNVVRTLPKPKPVSVPVPPVTVTFPSVTQDGLTSLATSTLGPPPPVGFQIGNPPVYFYISTTALFTGPVSVCIDYSSISFTGAPQLFHEENGVLVNRTTSVDTVNKIICATVTSFSPFAIFQQSGPPPDTTPPVVTPPASINIPATEAAGARGSASAALAAFLAGGTAVDDVDPSPARLSPQVGGMNVDNTTLFALGVTTPVTFSFRDASGNVGMANASVTVVLGTPRISAAVIGKGVDASGARYVDLQLTNTGTGNARNVKINQLPLRTLSGSGTVSYNTTLSPALPISIGSLDVGGPKTVRLFFNVPATVTRYSLTESGTLQDVAATNYSFSASQSVIP